MDRAPHSARAPGRPDPLSRRPVAAATRASWAVAALLLVVLVAAGAVIASQRALGDRLTPGVVVLDVPVGRLTRAEAVERVQPLAEALLDRPLRLQSAGRTWDTTARALGLRLDPAPLVDAAYRVGREGSLVARLQEQLAVSREGRVLDAAGSLDSAALGAALGSLAAEVDRPARDARLALGRDGAILFTPAQTGRALDVSASRERVTQALASSGPTAELAVRELPPAVPDALVQPAREQLDRMLGDRAPAPLTLTFGRQRWPLARAEVLQLLSLDPAAPGRPAAVRIDERPLRVRAGALAEELDQTVRDARFSFNGGTLQVLRESREGRTLDQAGTVALIKASLLAGERTAALPVAVRKPAVSSENPRALGIVELIDQASTPYAGATPEKRANIGLAVERLTGVAVPPGGTFSFNRELGPTTLENGWQMGWEIFASADGPRTLPGVAGGISQVATTLFQVVFWAGYQVEERNPHLYWIPAYTSRGIQGLHATVDEAAGLDFQWINPTQDYVLIQASADGAAVTFSLYGRKPDWTVQVDPPVKTGVVPADPTPVVQEDASLPWGRVVPVEAAGEGFTISVVRRVTPTGGGEPRVLDVRSRYLPSRNVTVVGTAGRPPGASTAPRATPSPQTGPPADTAPVPAKTSGSTPAPTAAPTPPAPPSTPGARGAQPRPTPAARAP